MLARPAGVSGTTPLQPAGPEHQEQGDVILEEKLLQRQSGPPQPVRALCEQHGLVTAACLTRTNVCNGKLGHSHARKDEALE